MAMRIKRQVFDRRPNLRARFWMQVTLGILFAGLFVVTVAVPDWIEEVFGVEPDGGSGALEWVVVAGCGVAAIASLGLAGMEWRRAGRAPSIIVTE